MQKLKHILACILGLLMFCTAQAQPKIVRVEYYVDKDPGYGKAIKVNITSGADITNKTISVKIDTLKAGVHIMGIRALDSLGAWSLDNTWLFYKPDTVKKYIPNITQVEYYIDKDPGYNKGIKVAIENARDFLNVNLFINTATLKTGQHKIGIRSKDVNGNWSLDNVDSFTVSSVIAGPSITTASISSKAICAGGNVKIGYQKQGAFKNGNKFSVQLSDSLGKFATAVAIGSITDTTSNVINCSIPPGLHGSKFKVRIVSTNPKDTSANVIDSIKINAMPGKPSITSNIAVTDVCLKDKVTLTCSVIATSYKWNTGETTKSITVDTTGNYTVTVFSSSGCSTTSDTTKVIYQTCKAPPYPSTTNITATSAVLKWKSAACAVKYKIQYRIKNGTFINVYNITDTSYILTGLQPGTSYQWHVATVCSTNPVISSDYSDLKYFTTLTTFTALKNSNDLKISGTLKASLHPNPTNDKAFVSVKNAKGNVQVILFDINGRQLWKSDKSISNLIFVPVKNFATGNYFVRVKDDDNIVVLKLVRE